MLTRILTPDNEAIITAAKLLKAGQIAALPTETVYGLAADAKNEAAVKAIFEAKGRPQDNPLIVHIADISQLYEIAAEIPDKALTLAEKFWPGPLTMIFKKKSVIPDVTSGGLDTVAVRMPSHPIMQEIIRRGNLFIAAPSANISGRPSCTNALDVFEDFNGKIPLIIDGGECNIGLESTVLSLVTDTPTLFRPGFVTVEQLEETVGKIKISEAVTSPIKQGERVQSPGMKYRHYSPNAKVVLVKGEHSKVCQFIKDKEDSGVFALMFEGEKPIDNCLFYGKREDSAEQAKNLFKRLREVDRLGAKTVYVECPSTLGVGLATFNRLIRAAAFEIVNV
ncbi:MAG: threonylcarbamoyl-AMP synthase [Clostridia bacterium]|nr:threonylcarbamoyl-AMP synthase [Clostridia bacterium]